MYKVSDESDRVPVGNRMRIQASVISTRPPLDFGTKWSGDDQQLLEDLAKAVVQTLSAQQRASGVRKDVASRRRGSQWCYCSA